VCRNIMAFIDKRITYEDDKKENIKNLVSKLDKPRPTLNGLRGLKLKYED